MVTRLTTQELRKFKILRWASDMIDTMRMTIRTRIRKLQMIKDPLPKRRKSSKILKLRGRMNIRCSSHRTHRTHLCITMLLFNSWKMFQFHLVIHPCLRKCSRTLLIILLTILSMTTTWAKAIITFHILRLNQDCHLYSINLWISLMFYTKEISMTIQ